MAQSIIRKASPRAHSQDKKRGRTKDDERNLTHFQIRYPRSKSEFELQSYVMCELQKIHIDVRGEVPVGKRLRLDLVVFDDDRRAVLVIEIKRQRQSDRKKNVWGKSIDRDQIRKYKLTRVPVVVVAGKKEAEDFLRYFDLDTCIDNRDHMWAEFRDQYRFMHGGKEPQI